jgi:hypothetical protein
MIQRGNAIFAGLRHLDEAARLLELAVACRIQ